MHTCPAGHESGTDDYCETCGVPMTAAPMPKAEPVPCPACSDPVEGRYCESCGYDLEAGAPATAKPGGAALIVSADRAHWGRMVGSGEPAFPTVPATLTFELAGERATFGRASAGATDVDLVLSGVAADAAVSHHQCEFVRVGIKWTVRDLGSANGTWINDADTPLAADATHELADEDRILVGAWTCLTVHLPANP